MTDTNSLYDVFSSDRPFLEVQNLINEINLKTFPPIDPFRIAETLNIDIISYSETEKYKPTVIETLRNAMCDAIACRDKKYNSYYIMYDDKQQTDRIRFTICHEIGHIRLGHINRQGSMAARSGCFMHKKKDPIEREADIFATNLLMPEETIRKYLITPLLVSDIGYLKNWFGVSWEAFLNRLDELKIYSKKESKKMLDDWNSGKVKKIPPTYCSTVIELLDKAWVKNKKAQNSARR